MDKQVELLRQFVCLCEQNPAVLHDPKFAFYKEYLEGLGAKIPPKPKISTEHTSTPTTEAADHDDSAKVVEEEVEEPETDIELDMSGVIECETDEPLPMGDSNKAVTDEDVEKANEERDAAISAFNEGNNEKALEHYTNAIELNPGCAIFYAKRANVLLKMNKPSGVIRDCNKAIALNPDSAMGYKFRGRAYRLLGSFLEAYQDLAVACKLDYDEVSNEWLKEVEANAKKILERNRDRERRKEEKQLKDREERIKKAREARQREAEEEERQRKENASGGDDFGGAMPKEFEAIFKDPEVMTLIQDPEVLSAYMDITKNPANIAKHMSNPNVMKLIGKLGGLRSGAGMSGASQTEASGDPPSDATRLPPKMPDLD